MLFSFWLRNRKRFSSARRIGKQTPPVKRATQRPRLETLEDRCLPSTFVVTNTNDSGSGSLRQAILDSNFTLGTNTIDFNIAPGGAQAITPLSALPVVTNAVVIEGTSQPGFAGTPIIQLDGSQAGTAIGLDIQGGNSTIEGLVISNFGVAGLRFVFGSSNVLQGNYIGTDVAGTVSEPNGSFGVIMGFGASGNRIGTDGSNPTAQRNVIAGSFIDVEIEGVNNNVVAGNLIGTNAAGTAVLGSFSRGVEVDDGGQNNTIGGTATADRNVIGGLIGVFLDGTNAPVVNTLVADNYIGTDVTGKVALAPSGTHADGVDVANGASNNMITGNVISGNTNDGVHIYSQSGFGAPNANILEGNLIGTDATGTNSLGNGAYGVEVSASTNNVIGSPGSGTANTIAYNGKAGVGVTGSSAVGNSIRGNSIFANQALGIDLGEDGVTLNESQGHLGPNNFQNFPVLTNAIAEGNGTTRVIGTFREAAEPNTTITLDFYANATADPSSYGQGQTYLGSATVTTDTRGKAHFSIDLNVSTTKGQLVSATATDSAGNTSEFSADKTEVGRPGYTFSTIDDPAGSQSFAFGINRSGDIVGRYNDANFVTHGFLLRRGQYTTLDDPNSVGGGTIATGINAWGQIVGVYDDANGIVNGFLLRNGRYTTLNDPDSLPGTTSVRGINDRGQIVGAFIDASGEHGFVLNKGRYTPLDDPNAVGGFTVAAGINDRGEIVGWYQDAGGDDHGFLLSQGQYYTLDDPNGVDGTFPMGINNLGQIVGGYDDALANRHGFLLSGGQYTTLDDPSGISGTTASGINASGQIVGHYDGADGFVHAFLASPAPDDSAVAGPGPSAGVPSGVVFGDSPGNCAGVGSGTNGSGGVAKVSGSVNAGITAGSDGGSIFNAASGTLVVKHRTVLSNVAHSGADIYNLGALSLDDSTVGVIGP
jgi:probable HAF family extracellular repeat protein